MIRRILHIITELFTVRRIPPRGQAGRPAQAPGYAGKHAITFPRIAGIGRVSSADVVPVYLTRGQWRENAAIVHWMTERTPAQWALAEAITRDLGRGIGERFHDPDWYDARAADPVPWAPHGYIA